MEFNCPIDDVPRVKGIIKEIHPYETPVINVFPLLPNQSIQVEERERMDVRETILSLEKELLKNDVRASVLEIDRLIHDDFLEFGKSGGTFHKADLMGNGGAGEIHVVIDRFDIRPLAEDKVQAVYRTKDLKSLNYANRCSIWKETNGQWQMIFHQGTPAVD